MFLLLIIAIAILIGLLFLSAAFSGVETALFSLDRLKLRELEQSGERRSTTVLSLLKKPYSTLITILIGNLLVNTAATALTTSITIRLFGNAGLGLAIGLMTLVLLIAGEITPKTYAYNHATPFALRMALPLRYFAQVLEPAIYFLRFFTQSILKWLAHHYPVVQTSITEAEMQTLFKISEREGLLDPHERDWIDNIFRLSDIEAKDFMRTAADSFMLDGTLPRAEIEVALRQQRHSRVPVYRDDRKNIIGVLIVKDFLLKPDESLADALRPPLLISPRYRADLLLKKFRRERQHLAVVRHRGEIIGLVTLEDLLEEIFGEIYDERDSGPRKRPS